MSEERTIKPNAPADFTPQLGDYKTLQPFRYWCQKVLPLVYDDSLSYYELLCKVVDYLNKTMEDVETLHGDVNSLNTAYEELQSYVNNYFSTLDVQEEINNKLDEMASNGELYEIIRTYTDPIVNEQNNKITVLENRMNTFASLPEGSTSGNAELIDIRVPANGFNNNVPYSTAGNAVRGQVDSLNRDLDFLTDEKINLFNKSQAVPGYISNSIGAVSSNDKYVTSDRIFVKANEPIVISPKLRKFLAYDEHGNPIKSSYVSDETTEHYVFTPTVDGSIRVTFFVSDKDVAMVQNGTTASEVYEPYGKKLLSNNVCFNDDHIKVIKDEVEYKNNLSNVLYGKKWVACGDSFTHGDFNNSLTSDYIFTDGKYKGHYKVYPFFIGNRNNMEIVNEAINGSTMTYIGGSRHEFSMVNGRYTQIPSDADYITLYFGINDNNIQAPIGSIDDTENTTFYGAWNIVMEYLITNHPLAKIGIIITNGSTIEYVNAEIAIAEKWGIPYLNMATGVQVPTMDRTNKDLPQSISLVRHNTFCVNPNNNGHPNEKAHEYESTFIENWLRTL